MLGTSTNSSRRDRGVTSSPSMTSSTSSTSMLSSPFSMSNNLASMGSSSGLATHNTNRRGWFSSMVPVQPALEDPTDYLEEELRLLRCQSETEEAEEVTEKSDLDAAAEDRAMPLAFNALRHEENIAGAEQEEQSWRMRERMKTVSVALVICLNVGVDPPDVTKTQPCARSECWVDPTTLNPQRAIEQIGNNLQKQYERWQPRARYRLSLDPPLEEVRRLATSLRRNAREERVLFHYNGHGVPKPTANGEIWVFNRNYTQYIPLSLYDLQSWMGSPSIFVYDCSNAGIIVQAFEQFADQHEREYLEQINSRRNCIQLAACSATQILPMNPELPADLFTSCLTTPIKMALRWFVMQGHGRLAPSLTVEMLDKIPGQFTDRRTMLGELNWIFTAITDTIAWNVLPRELFQKLFRQDLLVASLFRNFLLAERIMRSYDCTPISQPSLPHTHLHPMWKAWDLAVDVSLSQLPAILEDPSAHNRQRPPAYRASTFFEEQLTAFEVWLKHGDENRPPPEQLPIVLQVLLSQAHRLRALELLGRFLDLGPWAVNLALSVGIFPYVLKLLQSSAKELRPLLVSIWAKILAIDPSCQTDLIRDSSHKYFLSVLQDDQGVDVEYRTWAAFVLASIVHNFPQGQQEAEQQNLISICLEYLDDPDPLLRRWLAIAIGRTWDKYEKAKWRGLRDNADTKLYELLKDPVPEVRAAAVFALGTFINSCQEERTEHANKLDHEVALHLWNDCRDDASPIVRAELIVALSYVVLAFEANFVTICRMALQEATPAPNVSGGDASPSKMSSSSSSPALDRMVASSSINRLASQAILGSSASLGTGGVYSKVWAGLRMLAGDPYPQVSSMAESLLIYLKIKAKEKERFSRLGSRGVLDTSQSLRSPSDGRGSKSIATKGGSAVASVPSSPARASFMVGTSPPPPPPPQKSSSPAPLKQSPQQQQQHLHHAGDGARASPMPGGQIGDRAESNSSLSGFNSSQLGQSRKPGSRSHNPSPTSTQTARDLRAPDLRTEFLSWSARYFSKQLMKHKCLECDCDHESARHWTKEWLYKRNLEVRAEAETQRIWLKTRTCRLDELTSSFSSPFAPRHVLFHPYNNQLTVAGTKRILVQDLDLGTTICDIEMRDRKHVRSQFTSVSYVNAHDEALLLAGSDDGLLRVYKDMQKDELEAASAPTHAAKIKLVSAWNALREIVPIAHSKGQQRPAHFGLRVGWEQRNRMIAVGGGACKVIRLWDANRELKIKDINLGADSASVSCLNFSKHSPNLLTAGFGDGSVRVYDVRTTSVPTSTLLSSASSATLAVSASLMSHKEHGSSPVLDCQIQDAGGFAGHVVSGAADGSIRVADTRRNAVVKSLSLGQPVSALTVHKRAFAVAARSLHGATVVHTLLGSGAQLGLIKQEGGGLLGHHKGGDDFGCVSFHPHLLQMATASATSNGIGVYRPRKTV